MTDIVEWAQSKYGFYVDRFYDAQRGRWVLKPGPIRLADYHARILSHIFEPDATGRLPYDVVGWAEPAKSGKSAVAGLTAEYMALHGERNSTIVMASNKQTQAASLMYKSLIDSIGYNPHLPGVEPNRFEVTFRNGNIVRAIPSSSKSEAGARFSLALFDELWGYVFEDAQRLWGEFKTDPTRLNSVKFALGYAGYSGESELWQDLLESGLKGEPIPELAHITNTDGSPTCWRSGRTFVFWSHVCRQPWQTQEWQEGQAKTLRPSEFKRMILTEFVPITESAFVEEAWWDSCYDPAVKPTQAGDKTPVVLALDLALGTTGGDSCALVGVSRWGDGFAVKWSKIWDSPGQRFDYDSTVGPALDWLLRNASCIELVYDVYQASHFVSQFRGRILAREFSQQSERSISDKFLYDAIVSRRLHHDGDPSLRKHILNSGAKLGGEGDRLRIVKTHPHRKIDACVALSMALYRSSQLVLPGDPAGNRPVVQNSTESEAQAGGVATNGIKLEYTGGRTGWSIETVSGRRPVIKGEIYTVRPEIWENIQYLEQQIEWKRR